MEIIANSKVIKNKIVWTIGGHWFINENNFKKTIKRYEAMGYKVIRNDLKKIN